MSSIKPHEKFLPTLPPQQASPEVREWLREEFDRIAETGNAALAAIDALRAVPRMFLAGDADDFNLDTDEEKFVNYTEGGALGVVPTEPNQVTGTIKLPIAGLYRLTAYMFGLQGSPVQNESILLLIGVNGITQAIAAVDVATNQTDARSLAATLTRIFAKDDLITMHLVATGDLGAFEVQETSLEMTLVTLIDGTPAALNLLWFP